MRIDNVIPSMREKAYPFLFAVMAAFLFLEAFFFYEDARLLDRKIESKQSELARIVQLKDQYTARKHLEVGSPPETRQGPALSLGLIEELAATSCPSGRLVLLKPSVFKEDKKETKAPPIIEVKVTGTPLGEMIAFVKSVESSGLVVKKLQVSTPQAGGQPLLDLYAMIGEK